MEYQVGTALQVDGDVYDIIGKIEYRNPADNCQWFEYRLISRAYRREKWLSMDEAYQEYSISEGRYGISTAGYHLVDSGTAEAVHIWGNVDVVVGDRAEFKEYEDATEEKIISIETWDDGEETSVGYYLDLDEISLYSGAADADVPYAGSGGAFPKNAGSRGGALPTEKTLTIIVALIVAAYLFLPIFTQLGSALLTSALRSHSIAKYLKKETSLFTYVTSITGSGNQKADVYQSLLDIDMTVKDILTSIEGDTEHVQQNTEDDDNSVAILTDKEYCLIYQSEDNQVLVQVSSRKYAYGTDASPYRARRGTYRYYRRYYYSLGYASDKGSYKSASSPYSSYDDTFITNNATDNYNTYSSSVRQDSVYARPSAGGGISSGK